MNLDFNVFEFFYDFLSDFIGKFFASVFTDIEGYDFTVFIQHMFQGFSQCLVHIRV
ncbi:Uncharacterised protein [Mycobacterium tuberculosis]|nr:Uncharacterised protein [Mycobacterium tuberculosis]